MERRIVIIRKRESPLLDFNLQVLSNYPNSLTYSEYGSALAYMIYVGPASDMYYQSSRVAVPELSSYVQLWYRSILA